jgi:hypothetical protein
MLGVGTSITMDFGAEVEPVRPGAPRSGELRLWIYEAAWRVSALGDILAGSRDEDEAIERALRRLENVAVVGVRLAGPAGDLFVDFGAHTVLETFRYSLEADAWIVSGPSGSLACNGHGMFVAETR